MYRRAALLFLFAAASPLFSAQGGSDHRTLLVSHSLARTTQELMGLLDAWRDASGSAKTALEAQIFDAAVERRGYLAEAMAVDPTGAYRSLLTAADRDDVDGIVAGQTAQPVALTGDLVVEAADAVDAQGEISDAATFLRLSPADVTLRPAGLLPEELSSGMVVDVAGYRLGDDVVFDAEGGALQMVAPSPPPPSVHNLLIVRDLPTPNWVTQGFIENKYVGANSVATFYDEVAYGNVSLAVQDLGYEVDLGISTVCTAVAAGQVGVAKLLTLGIDIELYTGFVFLTSWEGAGCKYNGVATIGPIAVPGSSNKKTVLVMGASYNNTVLHTHEFGHNLGANHAGFWDCDGTMNINSPQCEWVDYGDPISVMGGGRGHFNSAHKDKLGWFTGSQVETVTGPGIYRLHPLALGNANRKAIRIPRTQGDYLFVEYRAKVGYDLNPSFGPVNNHLGASIYFHPKSIWRATAMVDASLEDDPTTAALVGTETFTDPTSTVTLSLEGQSEAWIDVEVELGDCPDIDFPTVEMTDPAPFSTVSGLVAIRADADDQTAGVQRVEFILGETLVHTDTTEPYEFLWDSSSYGGLVTFQAIAYDDVTDPECVQHTASDAVTFAVDPNPPGTPPSSELLDPGSGSATVPFTASSSASDPAGIARVEFWFDTAHVDSCGVGELYDGEHGPNCDYRPWFPPFSRYFDATGRSAFLIGVDDTAPYSWEVDSIPPGDWEVWTRAYDNHGELADSSTTSISVTATTAISVDIPVPDGASAPAGDTITIPANVTADVNEVSYVDFFVGDSLLGRDEDAPWSMDWNVPPTSGATYVLKAKAYGLGGRTANDTVTVRAN